jgi:hypothetical protein
MKDPVTEIEQQADDQPHAKSGPIGDSQFAHEVKICQEA